MSGYDLHRPDYSGTTNEDWDAPRKKDFDTDDLSDIDDHFLLSESGFAPDDFVDLELPVVDPDDRLNLNALQAAHGGNHSVDSIDGIGDDTRSDAKDLIERLGREEFDHEIGD